MLTGFARRGVRLNALSLCLLREFLINEAGQTNSPRTKRCQRRRSQCGSRDYSSYVKGVEQAQSVARSFTHAPDLIVASPFSRAQATAMATAATFPATPLETWPIQEFTYLEPARCANTTVAQRRDWVEAYWSSQTRRLRMEQAPNLFRIYNQSAGLPGSTCGASCPAHCGVFAWAIHQCRRLADRAQAAGHLWASDGGLAGVRNQEPCALWWWLHTVQACGRG